jgi:hypothetical protein
LEDDQHAIAALSVDGIIATGSFDGATDTELFLIFVRDALVPTGCGIAHCG